MPPPAPSPPPIHPPPPAGEFRSSNAYLLFTVLLAVLVIAVNAYLIVSFLQVARAPGHRSIGRGGNSKGGRQLGFPKAWEGVGGAKAVPTSLVFPSRFHPIPYPLHDHDPLIPPPHPSPLPLYVLGRTPISAPSA